MATTQPAFGTADRYFYSPFKKIGVLVGVFDITDASGTAVLKAWTPAVYGATSGYATAPTTDGGAYGPGPGTQGIQSITRNSAGNYTIQLQGAYQRILGYVVTFSVPTTGIAHAPNVADVTPAGGIDNPGGVTSFNFVCSTSGIAADPDNGSQMRVLLFLDASSTL